MQPIMIQATSSSAGKTTLVAGLCRLLSNRGVRVTPFKSQNMALNAYVTNDGCEIARATAMQASAARQEPNVHMNPLLLKPKLDDVAQLIVHGKPYGDVRARDYFLCGRTSELQELKLTAIRESIAHLRQHYDVIIAEGAGSCAEPNLRELDVVNMGLAQELGAKVFIVVDVDKGGAFADILGSLEVMAHTSPSDIDFIAGFILNKFRGDPAVLQPAIDFTAAHTSIPIVGVLPFVPDLELAEEDRIREQRCDTPEIDIAVVYLPHISNASDFDDLADEVGVQLRYVKSAATLGVPDAIILPGTKNTTWDLDYIRRIGLEQAIVRAAERTPLIGICGGFQMLGRVLADPERLESPLGSIPGMGLLDFEVVFGPGKTVTRRSYVPLPSNPFHEAGVVTGYEIHSGDVRDSSCPPAFSHAQGTDGGMDPERILLGTFIHDLFANPGFTRAFVNRLRRDKGLPALTGPLPRREDHAQASYERLASMLERHAGF